MDVAVLLHSPFLEPVVALVLRSSRSLACEVPYKRMGYEIQGVYVGFHCS